MQIQVLTVELNNATSKAGKAYEQLVVAYKDLTNSGKVASKTIMPFGFQKDSFTTLKAARSTDVYDIDVQKNDAGYNDWIRATKGVVTQVTNAQQVSTNAGATGSATSTSTTSKGGWETPEERGARQVYIIKQSSLERAVEILSVGAKNAPKVDDVISLAQQFVDYVLGKSVSEVVSKDVGKLDGFEDDFDIPL